MNKTDEYLFIDDGYFRKAVETVVQHVWQYDRIPLGVKRLLAGSMKAFYYLAVRRFFT